MIQYTVQGISVGNTINNNKYCFAKIKITKSNYL